MVAKNNIVTAIREIDEALNGFVKNRACDKVYVFESEWGHVRALIGSDAFKDMNVIDRQELVWDYLRDKVSPEHLALLYGVNAMDIEEYKRNVREV